MLEKGKESASKPRIAKLPSCTDTDDGGRLQAVIMLSCGSVVGCPRSQTLPCRPSDLRPGTHFHFTAAFEALVRAETPPQEIPVQAGDVYIFQGGTFVHGCPAVKDEGGCQS